MKKLTALALVAVLALSVLAGCSLNPKPADTPANTSNIDRAATLITVGDEVITMGEYIDLFDNYASYYINYGYDIYSSEESLVEFQNFIVDLLAEGKILAYQAKKAGIDTLSEEKLAEIEAQVTEEIDYLLETYHAQAEEEAAADSTIDVEARTKELLVAETEYYTGSAMSYDEFVDWIRDYYKESAISELFREETLKNVTVSDADLQAWYAENLATQTEAYTTDGGAYKGAEEGFEKYGGEPVLYAPEGYSRVLHILIAPEEQPGEEYIAKTADMDALAAEYGELAFDAAISGTKDARMDEIVTEYKALQSEVAAFEDVRMAPALEKANEAYTKLNEGSDFATVMKEYTQDDSIVSFDTIAEKGLLISNKYTSEIDWSKEVKTAFADLQIGGYSEVIQDEEGCHIIYYLADETAGPVELNIVKEACTELLLADLQEEEWAAMLDTWKNDGSVTVNEELLKSYDGSVG